MVAHNMRDRGCAKQQQRGVGAGRRAALVSLTGSQRRDDDLGRAVILAKPSKISEPTAATALSTIRADISRTPA